MSERSRTVIIVAQDPDALPAPNEPGETNSDTPAVVQRVLVQQVTLKLPAGITASDAAKLVAKSITFIEKMEAG